MKIIGISEKLRFRGILVSKKCVFIRKKKQEMEMMSINSGNREIRL